jgi:outer membrane protein assembly factor BamA
MSAIGALVLATVLAAQPGALTQTAGQEVIAEVRIHGNHVSTDEEILKLSGIALGSPFTATTVADVTLRLKQARRFDEVEVLKRFASIADPLKIVLVIVVNEGPVRIAMPDVAGGPVRVVKRNRLTNVMWLPILDGEDGYGMTYGARVAYVGVGGKRSRLSFPLTWGGLKRAGAEFEHTFGGGPISRLEVGAAVQRQRNPAFQEDDDRTRGWIRAEKAAGPLRAAATTGWQHISFGGIDDEVRSLGASLTLDTRLNPVMPRNAVYATASVERVTGTTGTAGTTGTTGTPGTTGTSGATIRIRLEGRGYIGLVGQAVLVVRGLREDANEPLAPYFRSLLGGWSNLRGFKAGSFTGDTLMAGSAELRVPVSSPLSSGKLGLSFFVDSGAAYDKGARFRDQDVRTGVGGGVWMTVAAFRMDLSVAHGRGATTRVNFGAGIEF